MPRKLKLAEEPIAILHVDDLECLAPRFDASALGCNLQAVNQWFGLWAVESEFGQSLAQRLQGFNLAQHVAHVNQQKVTVNVGDEAARASDESLARDRGTLRLLDGGIALIDVSGTMMKYASSFGDSTSTVRTRQMLRAADRSGDVKQVLIRFETPGGVTSGTRELAADIAGMTKPVTVFGEDLMASAGFWAGSQAGRVYANAGARIGSIGVFTVVQDMSKSAEEMGVKVHLVTTGEFKGLGTPGVAVTDKQIAYVQALIDDTFNSFLNAVASGRKMSLAAVKAVADGRVFSAKEAVDLGLIDGIKTFDEVVAELRGDSRATTQRSSGATKKDTNAMKATIAELKAACPGAPSEFILKQLEAEATAEQAATAWDKQQIADLKAENETLNASLNSAREEAQLAKAELSKLKSDASQLQQSGGAKPVEEHEVGAGATAGTDAISAWNSAVNAVASERGIPRHEAARIVAREQPEIKAAYVKATN